jgi:hypothetical protein
MLTERDMTITEWIGRQGAVRAEHVMTRFSIGRTATYRRLHELAEFGLVRRHRLLYNDGGLLTATAEGLRYAGLDRLTPARISLALLAGRQRKEGREAVTSRPITAGLALPTDTLEGLTVGLHVHEAARPVVPLDPIALRHLDLRALTDCSYAAIVSVGLVGCHRRHLLMLPLGFA